jgi:hypothetical protein
MQAAPTSLPPSHDLTCQEQEKARCREIQLDGRVGSSGRSMLHRYCAHKRAIPVSTLVLSQRSIIESHNSKHSGADQQGYGNTADDRKKGMPAFDRLRLRSIGILRRCNTNPEFIHGDDTSMPVHFRADIRCVDA